MAYQSLYRRYRSQRFSEVLGQPHVTSALRAAVAEDRYGHAYLFSGPRGTGKTSTARVLAKALNCENLVDGEPCTTCESCVAIEQGKSFDLHELDAASHNKVDDIRDLISKVQLGSPGRTKVYILDEVHMLSSGAENALLKTLEEPPDHVVFVLATTEPQKVVATIRSRTQHFEFHLLPAEVLAAHVQWLIDDAGLDVGNEAIDYVLRQGGGSARDTLSALDLVAAAGGVPEGTDIAEALMRAIGDGDPTKAIAAIQEGLELGREPRTIGEELLELLRNVFLASMGAPLNHLNERTRALAEELSAALGPATLTQSLEAIGQSLVDMRQAPDPRVPLEVTLLRLTRRSSSAEPGGNENTAALLERIEALEARIVELEATPTAAPPGASGSRLSGSGSSGEAVDASDQAVGSGPAPSRRPARKSRGPRGPRTPPRTEQEPTGAQSSDGPSHPDTVNDNVTEAATGPTADAKPLTEAAVAGAFTTELENLSQKVRVRFRGGRVMAVEGNVVRFGVPNPIHRDRCLDVKADVEQALSAFFGQPVIVEVELDDASAPPVDPAKLEPKPQRTAAGAVDEDIGPVEELKDASDHSSGSVERITKAFPGSQVIDAPST